MKKVLVVDDIAYSRMLYGKTMKKLGYSVIEASDGETAIRKAKETVPDLILLDLNLPDMTGKDVLRVVREKNKTVPVVIITANEDRDVIVQLMRLGISDYLIKPVDVFVLQKRVLKMFAGTRNTETSEETEEEG